MDMECERSKHSGSICTKRDKVRNIVPWTRKEPSSMQWLKCIGEHTYRMNHLRTTLGENRRPLWIQEAERETDRQNKKHTQTEKRALKESNCNRDIYM